MGRVPKNGLGVPGAFKKRVQSTNKHPTQTTPKKNTTKATALTESALTLGEAVGTVWFGPGPPGPFFGEAVT
jgi:hypothetical protein